MKVQRRQRLFVLLFILVGAGMAVVLALRALQQNINLYYSPTDIKVGNAPLQQMIRGGGLVVKKSLKRSADSLVVRFEITDLADTITVKYTGILPDLFREEQGVVVLGEVKSDGIFYATEVLAKHDSTYMPPEVKMAIDKVHESKNA